MSPRPNFLTRSSGNTKSQLRRHVTRCLHAAAAPAPPNPPNEKVIFSGIQPTGVPHLGNYLGAMKNWVRLQNEAAPGSKLFFSVVDLHAITVPQRAEVLREQRWEMMAALLAVGLDPERCSIFYQSDVPGHTELMWILSCTASMGSLSRMTQWKSKLSLRDDANGLDEKAKAALKLGLFSYPVLQAADILVHRATHVPVGEDQKQHLEFARQCATGFNAVYGQNGTQILIPPETILSSARRVMSLTDPTAKMSKSDPRPSSRILITDTPAHIQSKISRAVTDSHSEALSYDPATRPGVSNLLDILSLLREDPSPHETARDFAGVERPMKALKASVAEAVIAELEPLQERYRRRGAEPAGELSVHEIARAGAAKAGDRAKETIRLVKQCMGML